MKLRLSMEQACQFHNYLRIAAETPELAAVRRQLERAGRRIEGALQRTGRDVERTEHGWSLHEDDFSRSLRVDIPRDEVLTMLGGFLLVEDKLGGEIPPPMMLTIDGLEDKLVEAGEDLHKARDEADAIVRGVVGAS